MITYSELKDIEIKYDSEGDASVEKFFESRGLCVRQLKDVDLTTLNEKLSEITSLITNPEQAGIKEIVYEHQYHNAAAGKNEKYIYKYDIAGKLAERKSFIGDLIKEKSVQNNLDQLITLSKSITDPDLRDNFEKKINESVYQLKLLSDEKQQPKTIDDKIRLMQTKNLVVKSFLERETMASVIGAALLILLIISLIVCQFTGIKANDYLISPFNIILGYFFAQIAANKNKSD